MVVVIQRCARLGIIWWTDPAILMKKAIPQTLAKSCAAGVLVQLITFGLLFGVFAFSGRHIEDAPGIFHQPNTPSKISDFRMVTSLLIAPVLESIPLALVCVATAKLRIPKALGVFVVAVLAGFWHPGAALIRLNAFVAFAGFAVVFHRVLEKHNSIWWAFLAAVLVHAAYNATAILIYFSPLFFP